MYTSRREGKSGTLALLMSLALISVLMSSICCTFLISNSYRGQICITQGQQPIQSFQSSTISLQASPLVTFLQQQTSSIRFHQCWKKIEWPKIRDLFSCNELKHWMQCHSNICPLLMGIYIGKDGQNWNTQLEGNCFVDKRRKRTTIDIIKHTNSLLLARHNRQEFDL